MDGIVHNFLKNMNLKGVIGERLAANENQWIHKLLEDNPGLLDRFFHSSDESIHKEAWYGEFPGKLLTGIAQS